MIRLNRPLCVFDLETTGVNVIHDRIVEICIIKVNIDNSEITKVWRINPTIPIPSKTHISRNKKNPIKHQGKE